MKGIDMKRIDMKRILTFSLAVLLALGLLCACTPQGKEASDTAKDTASDTATATDVLGEFRSSAYFDIEEGVQPLSDIQLQAVISQIPSNFYEAYPETHGAPLSATLYKDGEVIKIDANDERLIALTNFFNNCVYYSKCSYVQSLLSIDYLEENVIGADFRLELTYTPYGENAPGPYETCTSMCDTVIFTNADGGATLIAHDLPGYKWEKEKYPYCAVGYVPLYRGYPWLELFGF